MPTGIELMAAERKEHFTKHGRSIEDDVEYNQGLQLAEAASQLADPYFHFNDHFVPNGWTQDLWDKMCNKFYEERLIIAGALIAAELDRLQWIKNNQPEKAYA